MFPLRRYLQRVTKTESDDSESDGPEDRDERFMDLPDGSGCVEIWEHLSDEQREEPD